MVFDFENDSLDFDSEAHDHKARKGLGKETVLELIENDKGQIVLRDASNGDEPLVTIDFSEKVQDMLGGDVQGVGHKMVHAAIQAVMKKQVSQWHANVYDEEPEHYS